MDVVFEGEVVEDHEDGVVLEGEVEVLEEEQVDHRYRVCQQEHYQLDFAVSDEPEEGCAGEEVHLDPESL